MKKKWTAENKKSKGLTMPDFTKPRMISPEPIRVQDEITR